MTNSVTIPRPEYPRPQMVRESWINLNGPWAFEFDHGASGRARSLHTATDFSHTIQVPFCPESELSGIEYKDFMRAVWYRRTVDIPSTWQDQRVILHFGAVDYNTEVWVNGQSVGTHRGGYASFSFDVTRWVQPGQNVLTVCAEDDVRSGRQPRGKQSAEYFSHGCDYTRTTGIWQTVWLECVPMTYVQSFRMLPDPDNACVHLEARIQGPRSATTTFKASASYEGKAMGEQQVRVTSDHVRLSVPLSEVHLWEPGQGRLYDLRIELGDGANGVDAIQSYVGLRTVTLENRKILVNGRPVFQRLVLDQGFYPDGIYTAPTDEALRHDIEISMGLGFNGARLHEKMFEPRFLYWADKLGYMVWGEHANWGLDISIADGLESFLPEWMEGVERDYNHPAIVGWCPFNETWDSFSRNNARQDDEVLRIVYDVTKRLDATRPVIDTSGNFHVVTDVFDVHDYDQNTESFSERYAPMGSGGEAFVNFANRQRYEGQPYFVSEYGGIWWNPNQKGEEGWGYGNRPTSEEEFLKRYEGLTSTLLKNPAICAFCYTQLYDVEQEVNGLYTYARKPKFDPEVIRRINQQVAAIEQA